MSSQKNYSTALTHLLDIEFPIIMAPMFLVSNVEMILAGLGAGVTGAIPALNYRTDKEFREAILAIKSQSDKAFGINLIVNKSNIRYPEQLKTCLDLGVDYVITSLGSPQKVIEEGKKQGMKVFCDVVNIQHAKKVEDLGADAVIAVNSNAGGHAGPKTAKELIPALCNGLSIPVISAGGIGKGDQLHEVLQLGACGISMGSPFIASKESPVSAEYKQACIDSGSKDIVMTTKLSGTPCTVINTPYVQKIGTEQNWLEKALNKNRKLKKWAKLLTAYRGTKALEKAAFGATYKTMWCAGPSIEYTKEILGVAEIVRKFRSEFESSSEGA